MLAWPLTCVISCLRGRLVIGQCLLSCRQPSSRLALAHCHILSGVGLPVLEWGGACGGDSRRRQMDQTTECFFPWHFGDGMHPPNPFSGTCSQRT